MSHLSVLAMPVLTQLGEQIGDPGALHRFVERYVGMLAHRVQRLDDALTAADREAWDDAALSLRTSSAMVGAQQLSQLVAQAQTELVSRDLTRPWPDGVAIAEFMAALRVVADATECQLRCFLRQPGSVLMH